MIDPEEQKSKREQALQTFLSLVDKNMSKTRYISFPDAITDPFERRLYFSNAAYKMAVEEAAIAFIEEII